MFAPQVMENVSTAIPATAVSETTVKATTVPATTTGISSITEEIISGRVLNF
jgi:hypothetical protein